MAKQYVNVSLEDMDRFLKRAFRVLRPKQKVFRNTYYYDLSLSPNVAIRVYTSITTTGEVARGRGKSAIRVGLFSKAGRPLRDYKGKLPIVERIASWRTNLQNRIETEIEKYDEKEDYFESRAGGSPEMISSAQVGKIKAVVRKLKEYGLRDDDFDRIAKDVGVDNNIEGYTKVQASQFIEALVTKEEAVAKTVAQEAETRAQEEASEQFSRPQGTATWTKLRNGQWGLRGHDLVEGEWVTVTQRSGRSATVMVGRIVWTGRDGLTLAEVDRRSKEAADQMAEEDAGYMYERTAPA